MNARYLKCILKTFILFVFIISGLSSVNASITSQKTSEIITSASLSCGIWDCRRRKFLTMCPTCQWNIPYCLETGSCVSCTGYCIPFFTDPAQEEAAMLSAGVNSDDVKDLVPPPYAHISNQPMPENCIVEDGSEEKMIEISTAVWNPTEMLRQLDPFGVTISNDMLKSLVASDPHAAWVVGQRMRRGDGLMAGIDIHQGQLEKTTKITAITGIEAANGDSTLMDSEYIDLQEGEIMHLRYRTSFGRNEQPSITVETYILRPGSPALNDYMKTIIKLSAKPTGEMLVLASDGYMAPLYAVEGFEVSL